MINIYYNINRGDFMIDDKLITFVEVVECENYTLAAKNLHLTQPAVTQHIQALERYYQQKLILNTHKSFSLTQAGKMFYKYAKMQIHNEKLFQQQLTLQSIPIVIGTTLSIADYYIPTLIAKKLISTQQHYQIVVANTNTLIHNMMNGEVECAFIEGSFDRQLFDYHLFKEERFIPVARYDHPLTHQTMTFDDLLNYPLFIREKGSGTRAILEDYLIQSPYHISSFHQSMEIGSLSMIKTLLRYSDGITFVYEGVVKKELDNNELVELSIKDFHITRPMHFIYLKSNLNKETYKQLFHTLTNT